MKIIKYINNSKLIQEEDNRYIIKKRKVDIKDIYSKLHNRGFNNFIYPIEITKDKEKYPYIESLNIDDNNKSKDIIYLSSLLHTKTTVFEEKNEDNIKERYENIVKELDYKYNYYLKLQDEIEEHIYMSPEELLLMNNISKIYLMIRISRDNIEKYLKEMDNKSNERKSIIHGNLSLDHIIESDKKYLISWNKSKQDIPVYDLVIFYKKEFEKIEINSLYKEYLSKYQYNDSEKYLFFSLINIPDILHFNNTHFINTLNTRKLVNYLDKTIEFTLEQNKENQETN